MLDALDAAEIGARWTSEQWEKALEGGVRARKMERHQGPGDPPMTYGYVYWRRPQLKEGT